MSALWKIIQVISLFIAIFALGYFIFQMSYWFLLLLATLAVGTLDFLQSEHDLKKCN
jgi:hypothetical protein|tara:strand:+ start:538 stop:708 length:171 start_codon:yes stop_codon:yes gene_type:complete